MDALDFFRPAIKTLHTRLLDALQGLTPEQLHFRPLDKGNHIAFTIWHFARTEDNVLNDFVRNRPSLWVAEGWEKKLGPDLKNFGTGLTADQAAAARIADLAEFTRYIRNVFQTTETYLEQTSPAELEGLIDHPVMGKTSRTLAVGRLILTHGCGHLGEIWYAKGTQGLKGSPI
jgi:hypothetical protein